MRFENIPEQNSRVVLSTTFEDFNIRINTLEDDSAYGCDFSPNSTVTMEFTTDSESETTLREIITHQLDKALTHSPIKFECTIADKTFKDGFLSSARIAPVGPMQEPSIYFEIRFRSFEHYCEPCSA